MSGQDPQVGAPPAEPQVPPQVQPQPPPRRNEPSRLRVAGAVVIVMVIVFSAVFATIVFANLSDRFSVLGQSDKDGDGVPDAQDKFPNDPWEWVDSDNDGIGDNGDPFPLDHDNDGFNDTVDLFPQYDAALRVSLNSVRLIDRPDLGDNNGEVAFFVSVDHGEPVTVIDNGTAYVFEVGTTYNIARSVYLNIADDVRYHAVTIRMIDVDPGTNETLDLDPISDSNRTLDLTFDLLTGSWTGDDSTGFVNGSNDGTQLTNDRDAALSYSLSVAEYQNTKTYRWSFQGHDFMMEVNVSMQAYLAYKVQTPNRAPGDDPSMTSFVTSSDPIVVDIASKLKQMATIRGYNDLKTVGLALAFVQGCIHYSYDNVSTGQDEYWRYSVESLYEETGDCEDDSILLASVLEAMHYDAVLFLFWEHMAVGVDVPGASGDSFAYNSVDYFYCETTAVGWTVGDEPPSVGTPLSILQVS